MASHKASTSAVRLAGNLASSSIASSSSSSTRLVSSARRFSPKSASSVRHQSTASSSSSPASSAPQSDSKAHSRTFSSSPSSSSTPSSVSGDALPAYSDEARILRAKREQHSQRQAWRESLDHLNTLGSTQNRSTTWRPAHARNRPVSHRQVTLSHLLAATAQVGHSMSATSRAFQPWIYGTRQGIAQIDLEKATMPALRKASKVVQEVVLRDGVVLFVGTTRETQRAVVQASKRLGGNGYHVTTQRWMPGCLTNASTLLQNAILASKEDYIEQYQQQKELNGEDPDDLSDMPNTTAWASKILQPDLLVILNTKENHYAAKEATLMNIPTIGIVDTDVDPRLVTYPIPANDESVRTQELIVGVLSKAGEEGYRQRRRLLDAQERVESRS
ncbi:unnamed protein product [Sympodiomycopsis kandeliae]